MDEAQRDTPAGVIRARSLSELFDLAVVFASLPLPAGNRIAIVTNAGGPGIIAAEAMVREVRAFPLLQGVRGEPPADLAALVEDILRLSQLVTDFPEIAEIDINPLLVRSKGEGTVALDARIRLGRINT